MIETLERVRELVAAGRYAFSNHAYEELAATVYCLVKFLLVCQRRSPSRIIPTRNAVRLS